MKNDRCLWCDTFMIVDQTKKEELYCDNCKTKKFSYLVFQYDVNLPYNGLSDLAYITTDEQLAIKYFMRMFYSSRDTDYRCILYSVHECDIKEFKPHSLEWEKREIITPMRY